MQKILDDVKNEVKIIEKNYEEIKEKLEYLNKKDEGFEAILEVEKIYKNKLENLTEKQWLDLTHKFVDKIYIDEENIRVVMRVGEKLLDIIDFFDPYLYNNYYILILFINFKIMDNDLKFKILLHF